MLCLANVKNGHCFSVFANTQTETVVKFWFKMTKYLVFSVWFSFKIFLIFFRKRKKYTEQAYIGQVHVKGFMIFGFKKLWVFFTRTSFLGTDFNVKQ